MAGLGHWADALIERHLASLTSTEFLRAARALSARYVEQRRDLVTRSPLDSAGKRAAFAVLYGPIHFATTRAVVEGLALASRPLDHLVDLGCGTGAASAAWATCSTRQPRILGIDRQGWVLAEARWTWQQLGVSGRTLRADLVREASHLAERERKTPGKMGVLAAWSANELPRAARDQLLDALLALGRRGTVVVVVEPISTRVSPWWNAWAARFEAAGGRADTWQAPNTLPAAIRRLDREAGFDRPALAARSLALDLAKGG